MKFPAMALLCLFLVPKLTGLQAKNHDIWRRKAGSRALSLVTPESSASFAAGSRSKEIPGLKIQIRRMP